MERASHLRLVERLRAEQQHPERTPAFTVAADRYRDPARCDAERSALFGAPRVIAASSSIAPGACVPVEVPGRSLILIRDADRLRAFSNACRHRATRLVDAPCTPKAVVCRYHGWTYDLRGALIHVPHAESFGDGACERRDLREVAITERHGLVWLGEQVETFLGGLDADLAVLGLEHALAWRSARTTRRCNWKLAIEAFLDGYHIRVLHRDSIYRFFLDAASVGEPVGDHIRAVTGRRPLREAPSVLADVAALRELTTPSYLLFPATIVLEHPDFVSVLTLHPLAADVTQWDHLMLVPAARVGERDHWDKSWTLIEDTVFQGEDLWVCEQVQRGITAGTTDELLFGSLESPIRWFHDAIDRELARAGSVARAQNQVEKPSMNSR